MPQAVIMAAGRSTRTYPLTATRPKPLLPLAGKPLLDYQLDQLRGLVNEVLLVVGYRSEQIRERCGERYRELRIRYVEQREQRGTADAVRQAARWIAGPVLVMNGDDLYERADLAKLLDLGNAILLAEAPDPQNRAIVEIAGERIVRIVEKPADPPPGALCSIGAYAFEKTLLPLLEQVPTSPRGERELPDFVGLAARETAVRFHRAEGFWFPLTYAWDVLTGTALLLENEELARRFHVDRPLAAPVTAGPEATIEGPVWIAPGAMVGASCHLRGPLWIDRGCRVEAGAFVESSVLFPGVRIGENARVSHSVLGEAATVGAGAEIRSAPDPGGTVFVTVKGKAIDSRRERLGVLAGDRAIVPDGVRVSAGRILGPGESYVENETVI